MNNLIDHTYFKGNLTIANAAETGSVVQLGLTYFITTHQLTYLLGLLGVELYKEFDTWNEAPTTEGVWFDLLNGKFFNNVNGRMAWWPGFRNNQKISPLANYVYYRYQEDNATQTVSSGEAKVQMQNAAVATAVNKMVSAWNGMVEMDESFRQYMDVYFADNSAWSEQKSRLYGNQLFKKINSLGI